MVEVGYERHEEGRLGFFPERFPFLRVRRGSVGDQCRYKDLDVLVRMDIVKRIVMIPFFHMGQVKALDLVTHIFQEFSVLPVKPARRVRDDETAVCLHEVGADKHERFTGTIQTDKPVLTQNRR